MSALRFFAPCTRGAEQLLVDELKALGAREVRRVPSGASFTGELETGYRALLWSRTASRVLLRLADVDASNADALYESVLALPWDEHLRADGTLAVDAGGMNAALRNTQFTAVRVKDAVCDRFRSRFGRRPSVDARDPDLRINVAVRGERASVSIDLAGTPLHRRGYRAQGEQVEAPLKETLAASVLLFARWGRVAARGGALLDPLCGSATLAIEGAMIAGDIAPGLLRASWGFDRWLGHDEDVWHRLLDEADERAEKGRAAIPPIVATDTDPRAIAIAQACVKRAGLDGYVTLAERDLRDLVADPAHKTGLIATNPPWGERLQTRAQLPALYAQLSARLHEGFWGWELVVVSPDPDAAAVLGVAPERTLELASGPVTTTVSVSRVPAHVVPDGGGDEAVEPRTPSAPGVTGAVAADDPFANRLRKMARHTAKWARRAGVSCYRIYDADLPDYAVAIDRYQGAGPDEGRTWVHVAEYAPPAEIDELTASRRLTHALAVIPEVLEVAPADVFLKRRERKRGAAQYERLGGGGATGVVSENGLLFEVNLSDYLDTGLFLDHRDTRALVREMAEGTRFLNLFAYTGSATVYAADGGAVSTTTVDLSQTYIDWAGRNLARNGFSGPSHELVRADTERWLQQAADQGRRFDLVFCDPPTFSSSKRMSDTFDVQRDHVELILGIRRVLTHEGTIVFSNNRRKFQLDVAALGRLGLEARDITARTIPKDFERTPGVHSCWIIKRAR